MVFHLRTVESAFAFKDVVLDTQVFQRLHQSAFSLIPGFIRTDTHRWTSSHLVGNIRKAKVLIDLSHEAGKGFAFRENLVFRTEDVTIVLREGADTHHTVQGTRRFVTVALTEFTQSEGKITVAAQIGIEELDVTRAVHRLQRVVAVFRFRREHVFTILGPVTRAFPQGTIQKLRSLHFLIAVVLIDTAHILFDNLPNGPAFGVPENHPWSFVLEVEEIQFLTQTTMVAQFCFFEHLQVSSLIFLVRYAEAFRYCYHHASRRQQPSSTYGLSSDPCSAREGHGKGQ